MVKKKLQIFLEKQKKNKFVVIKN